MIFYKASILKKMDDHLSSYDDSFYREGNFKYYRGYLKRGCWRMGDGNCPDYLVEKIQKGQRKRNS